MIKQQILAFIFRWALSTFGMWICINLFGTIVGSYNAWLFVLAGLVFSIVNSVVKPLATTFTLPLIIVSMGLFTILINTAMVGLTIWILPNVSMDFLGAIFSSIIMSIANGLVNFSTPLYNNK